MKFQESGMMVNGKQKIKRQVLYEKLKCACIEATANEQKAQPVTLERRHSRMRLGRIAMAKMPFSDAIFRIIASHFE